MSNAQKLLVVMPLRMAYASAYEVTAARSYVEAKRVLAEAEARGEPFDALDINVQNRAEFWDFLAWMEGRGTRYPFSIFASDLSAFEFIRIRDKARARGFAFLD